MAMGAFPRFIQSEYFTNWQTTELKYAENKKNTPEKSKALSISINSTEKAIATVDQNELEKLLTSNDWFTTLITAVENLPICVTIASASKNRQGFPLVYVNAAFETTTCYNRSEIVGKNCRFLQSDVAEPESVALISKALKEAKPVKVAITNKTKHGRPFKNLLAMKPIFDDKNNYTYVISIQFDVTSESSTSAKLALADDLMKMIPNIIYT